MSSFIKNTKEVNQIVIIETDGYLNKEGGEAIAAICFEKIKAFDESYLINFAPLIDLTIKFEGQS